MDYIFTSFATTAPNEAAAFCVRYFGGGTLDASEYLTHQDSNATVAAVRWTYDTANGDSAFHDVYFIDDPTKKVGPSMDIESYEAYLHDLHRFDIQETWDWYQDWHLCFTVDNVDDVVYRLIQDEVPFVSRSQFSIYVEVPFGITFQILGSTMNYAWSEDFNFCRTTNGKGIETGPRQSMQITELPKTPPQLPPAGMKPSHHSFFSSDAMTAFNFTLAHTSAVAYDMSGIFQDTHRYGDGTCARLEWLQFNTSSTPFQVHFVEQFHKHQGPRTVVSTEHALERLHGDLTTEDQFTDFRVGFAVPGADGLAALKAELEGAGAPVLELNERSFLYETPGGIIFEAFFVE
eukprot:CAMPEP_0171738732 /NCGR_PEP_ID=MMETSP0991-20121206/33785_1 /TAXON_ID=483369 /ORGANISM="non described non described, Strain CCMP2098" /LENGTH=346 /DNA_ID=CAMNT_0012336159 /DNA_START=116 /DNA_END=1156 /DNA_ORIENTATION=+